MASQQPWLMALERTRCGGLVVDTQGSIVEANETGLGILRRVVGFDGSMALGDWTRPALKQLLLRADGRFRIDHEAWITARQEVGGTLVLHAIPLHQGIEAGGAHHPHTMLVLVDLRDGPEPSTAVLQRLFELTPAEARLAIEIGRGRTLQEVSDATQLSSATLRSHLSSIFLKTGTRRQAALVALLARIAILP